MQVADCILWTGAVNVRHGYGQTYRPGEKVPVSAHRLAYEREFGAVPAGKHLHHVCETRLCVNPHHLQPLTPKEHREAHYKDACHAGHSMDEINTYVCPKGYRHCRRCRADAAKRLRERRAA